MNPIFSRILKALCTLAAVALLSACGSSSTVDPFKPTRVIGLGDGYNDVNATVREGSTTDTVVQQVAASFGLGQSSVVFAAGNGKKIADLATQITSVGSFSEGDLVVITVGTHDVIDGTNLTDAKNNLVAAVQSLLNAGVKHVLIMPVLEVSRAPWGRTTTFNATATNTFNDAVLAALGSAFGGHSANTVIYANTSGVTAAFLTATSATTYPPFTDTGFSATVSTGTTPACGSGSVTAPLTAPLFTSGCATSVPTGTSGVDYTTMLFADGIHLTPAGNRWVASYLYNATAQGWR
ncbi:hypothetical protein B9Z44_06800 [Limnohabitans curvus]|uniref:SGNH hydrolase-type esterase domain-containing protein n=1 Tax=Limnohabitans curvus TaxID=323423 RepID=A0A315ETQ6_9BURK|nr:SGNH/GDSL hydrolase family protein [Limnohabitans curvus]PUE59302.1 hypothetical protein B9Z44_06800 [Limnohabitans curvus]